MGYNTGVYILLACSWDAGPQGAVPAWQPRFEAALTWLDLGKRRTRWSCMPGDDEDLGRDERKRARACWTLLLVR
jgi:hypothetical protein